MSGFEAAASLTQRRSGHHATTLADGGVLVWGGIVRGECFGVGPAKTVEIWDRTARAWTTAEGPRWTRTLHYCHREVKDSSLATLADGSVVLFGGYRLGSVRLDCSQFVDRDERDREVELPVAAVELWDPTRELWTTSADLCIPRQGCTATILEDGRILVVGGDQGQLQAELWDPATRASVLVAAPIWNRESGHTATLLRDGRVLVVGGVDGAFGKAAAAVEIWDGNSWQVASSLLEPRTSHSATLLADGRVLVLGGFEGQRRRRAGWTSLASAEVWDPESDRWRSAGVLATSRGEHSASLLRDGCVLVVGGICVRPEKTIGLSSAEIWNPALAADVQRG